MNGTTTSAETGATDQHGRVLVLEPDEQLGMAIIAALREAAPQAQVNLAHNLHEAQQLVVSFRPDLFVLDVDAAYDLGQEFLYDLRTSHPRARAIVLTGTHFALAREKAAGLGAIHFLEKPFPHGDFVDLVGALLHAPEEAGTEKFQGTLSDLHIADIIQLKCMSGATSGLEFTGPRGEKARVFFENGQVCHAVAPGKQGVAAFNEIVNWKGGMISEVSGAGQVPRSIDLDWQILLMEAVRKIDETRADAGTKASSTTATGRQGHKVLVIDDSLMLLSFVKEILGEASYEVITAPTANDGLQIAATERPDLILLDYILPDMKGDEVIQRLGADPASAGIPVVYMSGLGADIPAVQPGSANVIGSLNKPFTSELLISTVQQHMPKEPADSGATSPVPPAEEEHQPTWSQPAAAESPAAEAAPTAPASEPPVEGNAETASIAAGAGAPTDAWWSAPTTPVQWPEATPQIQSAEPQNEPATAGLPASFDAAAAESRELSQPSSGIGTAADAEAPAPQFEGTYFCGDTSFFSLNWALHTIEKQKLTGTLRAHWDKETVELLARNGRVLLVTTRDPELYCPESPITLVNVEPSRTTQARQLQRETGCPLFVTLAREELILREPAQQLVQHYGQKLFAQLWTARRVRFVFEQGHALPDYAGEVESEDDVDHWALATLRFIQFPELGDAGPADNNCIPAYTRDGFDRVQNLRLTVAEAQFASQFNGVRSVAQIAKNLRLDVKFARLTLFRFLALEIVECWPAVTGVKPEKRGMFQRFGKSIGLGD